MRPENWAERYQEAYMREYSGKGKYGSPERAMFEAGADAILESLMSIHSLEGIDRMVEVILKPEEE